MNPPAEKLLMMQAEMARFENEISSTGLPTSAAVPHQYAPNTSLRFVPHALLRPPGGAAYPPPPSLGGPSPQRAGRMPPPMPFQRPFMTPSQVPRFPSLRPPTQPAAPTSVVIAAPPTKYSSSESANNTMHDIIMSTMTPDVSRMTSQINTAPPPPPPPKPFVAATPHAPTAFGDATKPAGSKPSSASKKHKNAPGTSKAQAPKRYLRTAGGEVWKDASLLEWDPSDYRVFCGDLGNEVSDELLAKAFRKYSSFQKAKVIRDKRTNKTKGYGFVSFKDPQDFIRALREMDGKYVGNRPIKLRKSLWKERSLKTVKKKEKEKKKLGLKI